ncbi:TPA: cell surface protein, partial [Streptococcus equi subsp. zooepidemicus]|nr:cell surface protein [Streptococcus equi subsp. zooepidemicus]
MITKKQRKQKRHTTIRRLCHQALAATLITGSLMGTGLLGNKVVYGDVGTDADNIKEALQQNNKLKEALKKVSDPRTLLALFAVVSGDTSLDDESLQLVTTKLGAISGKFVFGSGNHSNRKILVAEIKERILALAEAKKEITETKQELKTVAKDLETEKLKNGILSDELKGSREAHKLLSKAVNVLEEEIRKEQQKTKSAEETAQQATTEKEKAEKDAKTAQQESEQANQRAEKAKQEAEKAKTALETQKQKLEQEIKQAQKSKTEAEQKLKELQESSMKNDTAAQQLKKEKEALETKLQDLQKQAKEKSTEIEKLKQELENNKNNSGQLGQQEQKLKEQLN